jgi:hypothetical protein
MMGVEHTMLADSAPARPIPTRPAHQAQVYASHQKKQQQDIISRKMGQRLGQDDV